jgi:alpha-ribazole phosphatase
LSRLFLVRHGETDWVKAHRCHGFSDIPLNARGLMQAERLRERLRHERLDAVYSSDLQRAQGTARTVASALDLAVVPCPELREIHFGEFEGAIFEEIGGRNPALAQAWLERSISLAMPGGESLPQLVQRVAGFAPRLHSHDGQTVLIVAHSGSLRALLCHLLGMGLEQWWQLRMEPASVTLVETYPQGALLRLVNDVCHLEGLP